MAGISKTVVSLHPGKIEEVSKFIDSRSNLVTEIDGMIGLAVAVTGEDEITIIGVYESSKAAQAASDTVQKVFYDMASLMTSSPDRGVYSGVWFSK
jgi:quinol monooxygenase YgiN